MSWLLLYVATQSDLQVGAPPPGVGIVLSVAGTPISWRAGTLNLAAVVNGRDTLRCDLISADSTYRPTLDTEVVLTDDAMRLFGGFINGVQERGIVPAKSTGIASNLAAQGYGVIADERHVQEFFPAGTTLITILSALLPYLDGVALHPSQATGPVLPEIGWVVRTKTSTVLDELSIQTGWVWRIDADRRLRMIEPGSVAAPFNISAGDGRVIGDLTVEPTRHEYANRVYAFTNLLSSQRDDTAAQTSYGRVVEKVIFAPDETGQTALDALAVALLARSTPTLKRVQYATHEDGLEPGMTQTINLPARNINNVFLITDVQTRDRGINILEHTVTAIEGLVYQLGWREDFRTGISGGRMSVGGGPSSGGGGLTRFAYPMGGHKDKPVRNTDGTTWVFVGSRVSIDNIPRLTTSITMYCRMAVVNVGTAVTARLFNVTDNVACAGTSASVTSVYNPDLESSLEFLTFTATGMNAGTAIYQMQVRPTVANSDVVVDGIYGV